MGKNYKREILHEYSDLIQKYKSIKYTPMPQEGNYPIWVMWWQGQDKMPEIVKICYASILKNAGNHPVNLITMHNYEKYLNKMPHIEELIKIMNSGTLSPTHFSDICRCWLIYTYGGLWTDATVLLNDNVDNIITNRIFVSGRRDYNTDIKCSAIAKAIKMKWTSYFVFANKGNLIFKFISEILIKQFCDSQCFIHYFMMDYCFITAIECLPYAENIQQYSPIYPNRISELLKISNQKFDMEFYSYLTTYNPFSKLTYKHKYHELTKDGKLTYYGFIKKIYVHTCK